MLTGSFGYLPACGQVWSAQPLQRLESPCLTPAENTDSTLVSFLPPQWAHLRLTPPEAFSSSSVNLPHVAHLYS